MPALQTTYTSPISPAFAGMVADMRNRTVVSREVQGNVAIPFGAVALRGTSDHSCVPVGQTNNGFLGIAILDPTTRPNALGNSTNAYQGANATNNGPDTAAIMIRGVVWVAVAVAVTPGQPAYYDASGNITNVATSNTAIPSAVFETSTAGAGLAILRL